MIVAEPQPVTELPGFAEGAFAVQDLAAQLAAPLLDAADGMRVLDACAAPGGKTAHLLECAQTSTSLRWTTMPCGSIASAKTLPG